MLRDPPDFQFAAVPLWCSQAKKPRLAQDLPAQAAHMQSDVAEEDHREEVGAARNAPF